MEYFSQRTTRATSCVVIGADHSTKMNGSDSHAPVTLHCVVVHPKLYSIVPFQPRRTLAAIEAIHMGSAVQHARVSLSFTYRWRLCDLTLCVERVSTYLVWYLVYSTAAASSTKVRRV